VFALTTLTQAGRNLTLGGWVAHDVYTTNLTFTFQGTEVPEPSGLILVGAGVLGTGLLAARRQQPRD
jgi:hypothetical protein